MKLCLDQMLAQDVAGGLRARGHDAIRLVEPAEAARDDRAVLAKASRDGRTLITVKRYFDDRVVLPYAEHAGIICVEARFSLTADVLSLLLPFVAAYDQNELRNYVVVLSAAGERWMNTARESP
jgi:predicted nuclease of predicted toxin-antitoxin system